jgi:hypothetical protein
MPNVRRISQEQLVRDEFKDFWHQVMQRLNRAEDSTLFCKSLRSLMGLTWMTQDVKLVKTLLTAREGNLALDDKSAAELAFSRKMAEFLNPVTRGLQNPLLLRQLKVLCGELLVLGATRHGTNAETLLEIACRFGGTSGSTIRQRRRAGGRNDPRSSTVASTMHPSQSSLSSILARPATSTGRSVNLSSIIDVTTIAATVATQQLRSATTVGVRQTASAPSLTTLSTLPSSKASQKVPRDDSTILPFRQEN